MSTSASPSPRPSARTDEEESKSIILEEPINQQANLRLSLFPLKKSWRSLLLVYVLWVIAASVSTWVSKKSFNPWALLDSFFIPLVHVAAFGLISPIPWILWKRKSAILGFLQGISFSLVLCESTAALLAISDFLLSRKAGATSNLDRTLSLYLSLVGPGMMIVGGLTAARARSDEEREAATAEALVAKTRLLQSQVHPHVLFNALNGLAELIHKDPPSAERSVMHLADLMRRIMRASDAPAFPLSEERAVVTDFLALEGMRLGNRLRVDWDWDFTLDHLELPPLLLQPLVENAIKHGISPSVSGGEIIITLRAEKRDVYLEVWNSGIPFRPNKPGGIGIKNLVSRLALTCGSGATFTLGPKNGGTIASIHLPGALLRFVHERPKNSGGG